MEQIFRKTDPDRYPQKIFANQLITVDDLLQFKKQLLDELLIAFRSQSATVSKRWMKSHEVRKLLKISPGTLQTLKSSGVIPYTKVGGVHFYDYEDIQTVLLYRDVPETFRINKLLKIYKMARQSSIFKFDGLRDDVVFTSLE